MSPGERRGRGEVWGSGGYGGVSGGVPPQAHPGAQDGDGVQLQVPVDGDDRHLLQRQSVHELVEVSAVHQDLGGGGNGAGGGVRPLTSPRDVPLYPPPHPPPCPHLTPFGTPSHIPLCHPPHITSPFGTL